MLRLYMMLNLNFDNLFIVLLLNYIFLIFVGFTMQVNVKVPYIYLFDFILNFLNHLLQKMFYLNLLDHDDI